MSVAFGSEHQYDQAYDTVRQIYKCARKTQQGSAFGAYRHDCDTRWMQRVGCEHGHRLRIAPSRCVYNGVTSNTASHSDACETIIILVLRWLVYKLVRYCSSLLVTSCYALVLCRVHQCRNVPSLLDVCVDLSLRCSVVCWQWYCCLCPCTVVRCVVCCSA